MLWTKKELAKHEEKNDLIMRFSYEIIFVIFVIWSDAAVSALCKTSEYCWGKYPLYESESLKKLIL